MKKNIYKIVGLLLLLPLFSGCNDSDDVAAIFTGKTWKLNYITVDGGHEMFGFWENEEQEKASIKELNKNGTYNIVFDGTVDGDVMNGNIKGLSLQPVLLKENGAPMPKTTALKLLLPLQVIMVTTNSPEIL